jgi:hypothetical protein
MIFEPLRTDRDRPEGELRTLHLSLNAPVIAIDDLPVGPARAGIALGAEPSGSLFVRIAVRSLRSGEVVRYAPASDPNGEDQAALALEAGLSFAEGMGFLFDDEEAAASVDEPGRAAAAWRELVGDASGDSDFDAAAEPPALDLVHEIPVRSDLPAEAEVVHVAASDIREARPLGAPVAAPEGVLSKHRIELAGARIDAAPALGGTEVVGASEARIRLLSRF